ncbi:winged helix DNA-binding protein [Novosphingobium sp. TW-4]|uniref:Winged helix DNA-binding protein n=1 Tax=Novosphingobium olei TaxID=2728851 RepID=A0A7Y0GB30_9SPHN|nr:winged helix DNA-binding protein [Novosphingobium olei]
MDKLAKNPRTRATATRVSLVTEPFRGLNSAEPGKYVAAAEVVIRARAERRQILGPDLATESAWDILLALYCEWAQGKRLSATDVGHVTGMPSTSALRWLGIFVAKGVIVREDDPNDKRRTWINLTPQGVAAVERCLERLSVIYKRFPRGF